jgi:hypothetical protein
MPVPGFAIALVQLPLKVAAAGLRLLKRLLKLASLLAAAAAIVVVLDALLLGKGGRARDD